MIAVTGATGFIGSAIVRHLLEQGEEVRVLARPGADRRNINGLKIEIFEGDLKNPESLFPFVKGCNGLFHVAADYRLWVRNKSELFKVNCDGTKAVILAAAAAGVSRIVYTSSVATLGTINGGVGVEDTLVSYKDMIGAYKQSKYCAEELVRSLVINESIPIVIVNPSTPVGPRDVKPTPTGRMILEAALGKMPAYVDTGLNIVHVDDVAEGHFLAYKRGVIGARYILGGDNLTLYDVLSHIAKITGRRPPRFKIPHNLILPFGYCVEGWARIFRLTDPFITVDGIKMAKKKMFFSSAKAKNELGYCPGSANNALNDAVAWLEETGQLGR